MADWIRMPFGIVGRTGPGMKQVVRFGDWSTGIWVLLGANFGRSIVTNGTLRPMCDAAIFPNYFGQICIYHYHHHHHYY